MAGIQELLVTLTDSSATYNWQADRQGPCYISMSGTSGSSVTIKVGTSPSSTDGPTLRNLDDTADVTISSNQGIFLPCKPKYLVLVGSTTASPAVFTANVRINF